MSSIAKTFLLSSVVILSACHSIKAIDRPEIAFEEQWQQEKEQAAEQQAIEEQWWQQFNSPELSRLIDIALLNSPDLRVAAERVVQAELQMNNAGASLFPALSLSARSGADRSRPDGGSWGNSENSSVSLGMSYELDLWGRVAASRASAAASFKAQAYDYQTARLSLIAGVADAWFSWLAIQQRISHAEKQITIAEHSYQIVEARYRNGSVSSAELSSQKINLLNQQTALQPLRLQEQQLRAALAILVGQQPYPFIMASGQTLGDILQPSVSVGVPADILSRRPDLAAAEARLQAADANVKQARTALLPSLSLNLSAGRSATQLLPFNEGTDRLAASVNLAQVLFERGRLRNQVKISQSQQVALLEQYRKAIYSALYEVGDALERIDTYSLQERQQAEMLAKNQEILRVNNVRYKVGKDDLMSVLDAKRSVLQRQDQIVQIKKLRLQAHLDLYKSLGGAWQQ